MAGQLGQVLVNLADNLMVGKLGPGALASVSFSIALFSSFFVFGLGLSMAITPLISEADGAGNKPNISRFIKHGLVVSGFFALLCIIIILSGLPLLSYMGQEEEVARLAEGYLYFVAWSLLPFMLFQALKCFSDGMGETLPGMIIILAGNVLNVCLNYLLIFGKLGLPAMGVSGAAVASLIARTFMLVAMIGLLFYWKDLWSYLSACNWRRYQMAIVRRIGQLGIPTSLQMFFEVSAFAGAAVIMGTISKEAQAAHQIAINLASITFMICTGLAIAATIRVGNQLGKRNYQRLQDAGISAIFQVVLIMLVFSLLFALLRHQLPYLYLDDPITVQIAVVLLLLAAIFQVPDGVQVVALSALRGLQDVRTPTLITFVCYWLIAIPISYCGAHYWGWGPVGVWVGLIIGLTLSAALMTMRFIRLSKGLLQS